MKILHINKSDQTGGAAVAAKRLTKALRRNDVEAYLLVEEKKNDLPYIHQIKTGWFAKQLSWVNFVLERLYFWPHEREKAVRFSFSPAVVGRSLARQPLTLAADLLHLHWFNQGYLSISGLKKLFGLKKPIVWTLHDMWAFTGGCHYTQACTNFRKECGNCLFLKNPAPDDLSYRVLKQKEFIREKDDIVFVACSEWLAGRARVSSLLKDKQVVAIPNPIKTDHFRIYDRVAMRRELGILIDRPVVLFGAMNIDDKRKGFYFLQEALKKLRDESKLSDFTLLLFGKASVETVLNIKGRYKHIPYADFNLIVKLYNAADVTILPSLQDNLPNTVMESLACGTPVVAYNTGGIPEMIRHEETGYLATPGSVNELADGLMWALQYPRKEKLRMNARRFAEENYSENVVTQRYMEVYESLLNPIEDEDDDF